MAEQDDRYRDLEGSRAAIIRAARRAAEVARHHGQPLVFWRDGRIVEVMPDDLPPLPEKAPRQMKDPRAKMLERLVEARPSRSPSQTLAPLSGNGQQTRSGWPHAASQ